MERNEDSEMWGEYRSQQKARREGRVPVRRAQILRLRKHGFRVEELTPYCYRVNGVIDLYPTHNRYHNLSNGRRGGYPDAERFVLTFFNRKPK